MAVASPVSMLGIMAEFGGSGSFKDYYRGGPYVPNVPANFNISADPNSLSMASFAGAVRAVPMSVSITPATVMANPTTTATANVTGGIAPFSYQWSYSNSSGTAIPVIGNATSVSCSISAGGAKGSVNFTLNLTVTDAAGTQSSASVPATAIKTI